MDIEDAIHGGMVEGTHQQQQSQLDPNQLILMLQHLMQQQEMQQQPKATNSTINGYVVRNNDKSTLDIGASSCKVLVRGI